MGESLRSTYDAMTQIQETIAEETSLSSALEDGLSIINDVLRAESAGVWTRARRR